MFCFGCVFNIVFSQMNVFSDVQCELGDSFTYVLSASGVIS